MPKAPLVTVQALLLSGFRAYLEPKSFDFSAKPSLAVFGPNGMGKSGLVDAVEFLLSEEGTIERLGIRAIHNQAGVSALAHVLAQEKKISSSVSIKLRRGNDSFEGTRHVVADRAAPSAVFTLKSLLRVDPIIRGYALRQFVEEQKPEQRYAEVAAWLQLSPLVEVQRNLRQLRQQVKADADDVAPYRRINASLSKATSKALLSWSAEAVTAFANDAISPLDPTLKFETIAREDAAYAELAARTKTEENEAGLAEFRQICRSIEALYIEERSSDGSPDKIGGALASFEAAVAEHRAAVLLADAEKDKAANAMFAEIWRVAEPLFTDGAPALEKCPVCDTVIDETGAGSQSGIRDHILRHRQELAAYQEAKTALDHAASAVASAHNVVVANLTVLLPLIVTYSDLSLAVSLFLAEIQGWLGGDLPDTFPLKTALRECRAFATSRIEEIEKRQGEHTYRRVHQTIETLLEIKDEEDLCVRTAAHLDKLLAALNEQAAFISNAIRIKIQALLDKLRVPMNEIYKSIQGKDAAPVHLVLPSEDEANHQRLSILIDFAPNRTGVQPSGYLSDSQIHSLALALRLAAITLFNASAPIAFLDDIVTSYDVDHRRTIAGTLAERLSNLQIILTTHDQRFFNYLKDQLPSAKWAFTQITRLDRDYGPRFSDHKVTDEMVAQRWADGQSAANEMRQAEEEWLLDCCRGFGVDIRIRELDRAYSYDRSELALALGLFLKRNNLTPPDVPGVKNRFLTSLQKGEIENFGSHFQDAPYGDGSVGDERTRWNEFIYFRSQFVCPACKRSKFKRPPALNKPVCAYAKCETQFQFVAPSTSVPDRA